MTRTFLPTLCDLQFAVTAVVIDPGDWTAALREAGKRAADRLDTGLALEMHGQLQLISSNGTVNLTTCSVEDVGDLVSSFNYLLLDGRMFNDAAESLFILSRLAQLHDCRVVMLIAPDALTEIAGAIEDQDRPHGRLH